MFLYDVTVGQGVESQMWIFAEDAEKRFVVVRSLTKPLSGTHLTLTFTNLNSAQSYEGRQ